MIDELEKIELPFDSVTNEVSKTLSQDQKTKQQALKKKGKILEEELNNLIDYIENELFEDKID